MKIIFDDVDKECEQAYANNENIRLIPTDGAYSLNIRVSDVGKANMFLSQLLMGKEIVENLALNAGIRITSVNLYPASSTANIKDYLRDLIKKIEDDETRIT